MSSEIIGSLLMLAITVIMSVAIMLFIQSIDMNPQHIDITTYQYMANTCTSLNNSCRITP